MLNLLGLDSQYETPILVFNSLSWERDDLIEINLGQQSNGVFRNHDGQILPSQIVSNSWGSRESNLSEWKALVQLAHIPSLGFDIIYYSNEEIESITPQDMVQINESADEIVVENQFIRAAIDKTTGLLTQLYSKDLDYFVLESPSNKLLLFTEKNHCDAWNIDPRYMDNPIEYSLKPDSIQIIEQGPLRATVEIRRKILTSTYIQRISLDSGSQILITDLDIDLQDPMILCKLFFDTHIVSELVTAEIPYAYIDRSVKPQTLLDKARWEQACQRFISITDGNLGFTITNNGKYGYNTLPLLKEGLFFNPQSCDQIVRRDIIPKPCL